jgi:hypothetical protein
MAATDREVRAEKKARARQAEAERRYKEERHLDKIFDIRAQLGI